MMRSFFYKILKRIQKYIADSNMRRMVINNHHDALSHDNKIADFRKLGFSMSESAIFDLQHNDYRKYITTWEAYQPRYQNEMRQYFPISDDKYLFYLVFSHYVRTPICYALIQKGNITWLETNNDLNLYEFIISRGGAVIKERGGSDGFGIYVLETKGIGLTYKGKKFSHEDLDEIVSQANNAILQEKIHQGEFENNLFPQSINTIRIVTVRKPQSTKHEIVAALQRIGSKHSFPVDNFNQGGGCCLIDLETGRLGKMTSIFSLDKEGNRQFFSKHPDTGEQLEGKVIPHWPEVKSKIVELTMKLPFFEYIAWDVVLQDNGIAVIETNMKSSLNVFQIHKPMRDSILGNKYREHGWLVDE